AEGQPPPDLHAGGKERREVRNGKADEADERGDARRFHGPSPERMERKLLPDPDGEGVARRAIERGGEELHDPAVAVQGGERLEVRVSPLPKDQPLGTDHGGVLGSKSNVLGHPKSGSPSATDPALRTSGDFGRWTPDFGLGRLTDLTAPRYSRARRTCTALTITRTRSPFFRPSSRSESSVRTELIGPGASS